MDFSESQKDMNTAYYGGATGVLISGLVWCIAGAVGIWASNTASIAALFIGGTFIFPLSILLSKTLKRSGKHSEKNVLRHLAMEGLGILFIGLFLAYSIAQISVVLFYPIMLLMIGLRYLSFQTLYGIKTYWVLGGALIAAGFLGFMLQPPFIAGAFAGGVIELVFAFVLFKQSRHS